jgi:alpha-L-rhamnosidase
MREMAHALGKTADEQHYAELFDQIRTAYEAAFVGKDGFVAGASAHGSGMAVNNPNLVARSADTQTGYVLTLAMHLVPESLRPRVADHLVARIHANHDLLGTGFLGTPYLLAVLTDTGHADLAYHLLLNTAYPSWGYLVGHGATTMWERWNGDQMKGDPSMNSYNHYAYGAVADWIYRYAAGVDATPADAGFHTVLLHPVFSERLGSIDFRYASAYGQIHSAWAITSGKALWTITLPANTTGELRLTSAEAAHYHLNGKTLSVAAAEQGSGVRQKTAGNEAADFTLAAGSYSFVVDSVR